MGSLRDKVKSDFGQYQRSQYQFFSSLEIWLYAMPLLQAEDNGPEIIEEILEEVKAHLGQFSQSGQFSQFSQRQEEDILALINQVTKKKVAQLRFGHKPAFDPHLVDKLELSKPQGGSEKGALSSAERKSLAPLLRLLFSLQEQGMSKKDIAGLLFVGPSQVTNYFKKLRKEVEKIIKEREKS